MKSIVITTIFEPTEAVKKFAKFTDYNFYVIGDTKTPKDWNCPGVKYISIEEQAKLNYKLINYLPKNHYCRKMIGYLEAMKDGSKLIYDTDDDNIPYDDWCFPEFEGSYDTIISVEGFVNVYELFADSKIWPRGLPLNLINKKFDLISKLNKVPQRVGVWQGLADEDPDVDAIYRLTNNSNCYFNKRSPIVLSNNCISPYNTQNTLIIRELFPLLYLPAYVTFRYTDILKSLISQPIMWAKGYNLGFICPTVIQKRNDHDYMRDFISEIPMYETCEMVVEIANKIVKADQSIESNLYNVYDELVATKIVKVEELKTLEAWLIDIQNIK